MKINTVELSYLQFSDPERSKKIENIDDKDIERDIKLRKKSQELEAIFLTQLFKVMEKTVPKSKGDGSSNSLSSMMFSSVMGENLSKNGGIGLSDMLYSALKDRDEMPEMIDKGPDFYLDNINMIFNSVLKEND